MVSAGEDINDTYAAFSTTISVRHRPRLISASPLVDILYIFRYVGPSTNTHVFLKKSARHG